MRQNCHILNNWFQHSKKKVLFFFPKEGYKFVKENEEFFWNIQEHFIL
jgi:hypothetical protein